MFSPSPPCLNRRSLLAGLAVVATGGESFAGKKEQSARITAVFELFTSQGCSSCPPADMLFNTLRKQPGVLALSLPVTIWDHLGWKDTLAQPAFSMRQKGYAYSRGDRQIYTPQAVVNGVMHCVGSDQKALDEARTRSVLQPGVLALMPTLKGGDGVPWSVHLPDSPLGRPAPMEAPQAGATERQHVHAGSIVIVTFDRERTVEINKGENNGRTIKYSNAVRSITRIGDYMGAAAQFDLPAFARVTADESFAVLVQAGTEKKPGAIIGAVEAPRIG